MAAVVKPGTAAACVFDAKSSSIFSAARFTASHYQLT